MVVGTKCETLDGLAFLKGDPTPVPCPGNVTVVELWAKWCGPCRIVFPHLTQLYNERKAKGLVVVGISIEDDPSLATFVEKEGDRMGYTVAVDKSGSASRLMSRAGVNGIPHAFIVGKDGTIVHSGHPGQPEFVQKVDEALKAAEQVEKKAMPLITASREELFGMSVKSLKAVLSERGISLVGLAEKSDLVDKIEEHCRTVTYYA